MKTVVIGGSGLIGSKLVRILPEGGHDPLAASPDTGVNAVTGEGLAGALDGAQVVADVANAPSWDDAAVLDFFQTSSRTLVSAEAAAGVGHHVALSIVGTGRNLGSGYLRAKAAQEEAVRAGSIPYTIVRATSSSSSSAASPTRAPRAAPCVEPFRFDELVRRVLSAHNDPRQVTADVHARYFGAELTDQSLTPGANPRLAPTHFEDWFSR